MMNQKDLKFMGVVALATIVASCLLNLLLAWAVEDKEVSPGETVKSVRTKMKDEVKNYGPLDEFMYMAAVDSAFWITNSILMLIFVCLGVLAGQYAVRSRLI